MGVIRLVAIVVLLALGAKQTTVDGGCSRAGTRPFKILIALTDGFFPVFVNWVQFYVSLCGWEKLDDILFVCFDWPERNKLRKLLGIHCQVVIKLGTSTVASVTPNQLLANHSRPMSPQLTVWVQRAHTVKQLLSAGTDVFMVDLDAYWLRDPFPLVDSYISSGFDVVGSRGTFPEDVAKMFNATLCLGFAYFRSGPAVVSLWSQVLDKMLLKTHPDDQWSINHEIFVHGNFSIDETPRSGSLGGSFRSPDGSNTRVLLLSTAQIERNCDSNTSARATVAHCYSAEPIKSTKAKIAGAKGAKLWRVRKDWQKTFLGQNATQNHTQILSSLLITTR